MNVYFAGLAGVGIGPLAEIARDAGINVIGSDLIDNLVTKELRQSGITVNIGQDGTFLQSCHNETPLDWFVYTSALPQDHPELLLARQLGIRTAKRDEFLAEFIAERNLKLIAISGTHGKTTTTGMTVWAMQQLGIPVSYSIGTTIPFGPSGAYDPESKYFVYECDEYDKNFLHFKPFLSLLTSIDYDHPDTYPTEDEYKQSFLQYVQQSDHTIGWEKDLTYIGQPTNEAVWALEPHERLDIRIAGEHNRRNATLVFKALEFLEVSDPENRLKVLEHFPGTDRRFEKITDNLYSDYGHHPEEIAATLQMAHEISDDIILVYQPHQNWRQHFIRDQYTNQFELARLVYWAPTYLTRENPDQPILTSEELTQNIVNKISIVFSELNDQLWDDITTARENGTLVLLMGAGTIDDWARTHLSASL
ncbi:MAG: Mur ligase domain-containing protein [Candidatus Microsaccharimonas sp.]